MRVLKFVVSIIFVSIVLISASGQAECYEIKKGERMVYSARFLHIVPMGGAEIEVKDIIGDEGRQVCLITCEAKTAKWISLLFKAEAVLNAYVDIKKLYPYKFEQVLKVAGRPDDIRRAAYDRRDNIMSAEGKGRKKVPPDVRDPISAIYYLRTQGLKEGLEIKQMVNNNQSNYIFNSKVTGKRRMGKFDCLVLGATIRRENKSMYHSMDATIYISDDANHIPVKIEAKTKVGPLSLKLVKWEKPE